MKRLRYWIMAAALLMLLGCDTEIDPHQDESQNEPFKDIQWEEDVTGQLLPWDLIEDPEHQRASSIDYLDDEELVILTRIKDQLFVYPIRFMGVEVVNIDHEGILAAITYCPITKSSVTWNRVVDQDTLLLTASGYLLRENLMPLDLNSGSIWSQMRLEGMFGQHDKVKIKTLPMFETRWKTVKEYFPDALVFAPREQLKSTRASHGESGESVNTGRQLGILGRDQVQVFDLHHFTGEVLVHTTRIQPGGRVVVAGSSLHSYVVAYRTSYVMEEVEGEFPVIMQDESGTRWNIFGEAVDGERKGEQLDSPDYYMALHWAWEALFPLVTKFDPS